MSSWLTIKEIFEQNLTGQEVVVKAWIKTLRKSKKFAFMMINDGSSQPDLQVIIFLILLTEE